jgi:hypothetical protein
MQIRVRMDDTFGGKKEYTYVYVHMYVYMLLITLDYADKCADGGYIIQVQE